MPKIIKNLEEKIYNSAFELFLSRGYDKVDMKTIAKDIGIAVGTLYNYYPNKNKLYFQVLINSWNETLARVKNELDDSITSPAERLKIISRIVYEDIENRKGLGREVIHSVGKDSRTEVIGELKSILTTRIEDEVLKFEDTSSRPEIRERLIRSTIYIITLLVSEYENEKECNFEFLDLIIDRLLND